MRIPLDERSPRPLSDQLAATLAERIHRGTLAPGSRLPTVRALAEDVGLAPNTVAKAYQTLEAEGLIEGRGRRGTFVAERLPARPARAEALLEEAARAFVARARQLGASDADAGRAVRRMQRSPD
ncbi:MAG: GntR family transcriptional regulator [Actinomycetota bacterium]